MNIDELQAEMVEAIKLISLGDAKKMRRFEIIKGRVETGVNNLTAIFTPKVGVPFSNKVFKTIKHKFTSNTSRAKNLPFSAEGSRLFSGRFHLKNTYPTLYFADSIATINAELDLDHTYLPQTIWPAQTNLHNCLDISDELKASENFCFLRLLLGLEWRQFNDVLGIPSYSQLIGLKAFQSGYEGILIPSARDRKGQNLVLFPTNLKRGSFIRLEGDAKELKQANRILLKNQMLKGKLH